MIMNLRLRRRRKKMVLLLLAVSCLLLAVSWTPAAGQTPTPVEPACLEVPLPLFPGIPDPCSSPAAYIQYWYYLGLYLGGIAALMTIVAAGAYRVFFAFNPSQVSKADHYIVNATLGLILLFGIWLLLRTLAGPAYTTLRDPLLPRFPFPGGYGEGAVCQDTPGCEKISPGLRCVKGAFHRGIWSWAFGDEGVCVDGSQGDYCADKNDCRTDLECKDPGIGPSMDEGCFKPPIEGEGDTCFLGSCPSGLFCVEIEGVNTCHDGSYGDPCSKAGGRDICQESLVCQDFFGPGSYRCAPLS